MSDETTRAILYLLSEGRTFDEIFELHPTLNVLDVSRAAGEGLRALEEERTLRVETRAERIARVRETHASAFQPWSEADDALLLARWEEDASIAALSRAFGRPTGAIRMRLEKLLGPGWRKTDL